MEEILNELRKIRKDLDEQRNTIEKSSEKITAQVTQNVNNILEEKFKLLDENYKNLEAKFENQEKRLYFLEKEARKNNIVFFGIKETETSYSQLENNMINFIGKHFSQEIDHKDLQEVKRIGIKGEKPRPITVKFTTLGTKVQIIKKKKLLQNTDYYINEDFPQHILEKRKELQKQIKKEREKGNYATIRYDKLIIRPNNAQTVGNKKRILPTSPDVIDSTGTKQGIQVNKKNKTQTKLHRSSSISEGVLKPGILSFITNKNPESSPNEKLDKNMKQ